MRITALIGMAALLLPACGEHEPEAVPGEQVAEKLEDAADQSAPAAQEVLEQAADQARSYSSLAPVDEPGSFAQDAMSEAGRAQVTASPEQSQP